ncbi:EscN/YscN/HrcN family type III secretion system ATPase, partial [Salmonella enterica subsp. enterica serovar Infantis]
IIDAELREVAIGELCEIRSGWHQKQVVARAQLVGLQLERTVLSLIGNAQGLSRDVVLYTTGSALSAWVGYSVLGAVLDTTGKIVERFTPEVAQISEESVIDVAPPSYASRVG